LEVVLRVVAALELVRESRSSAPPCH